MSDFPRARTREGAVVVTAIFVIALSGAERALVIRALRELIEREAALTLDERSIGDRVRPA